MNFAGNWADWPGIIEQECADMSKVGPRILSNVRIARAFARGESDAGFIVHVPDTADVRAIRARLNLSQEVFAERFGFTAAAVRDWEQLRRRPEKAARALLQVIDRRPDAVTEALSGWQDIP